MFHFESKQIEQTHGYLNRAAKSLWLKDWAEDCKSSKNLKRKDTINVLNIITCSWYGFVVPAISTLFFTNLPSFYM